MASRKSESGKRGVSPHSERPGSYVKVSGSKRRRKARKGRSERPSVPPSGVQTVDLADAGTDVVASTPSAALEATASVRPEPQPPSDDDACAVDDLRSSRTRPVQRPLGPLGLDEPGVVKPELTHVAQVRLQVVELPPPAAASAPPAERAPRGEARARAITGELEFRAPSGSFEQAVIEDGAADGADMDPLREMDEALALARHSLNSISLAPRDSLSSVLDARPSYRASPQPEDRSSKWAWGALLSMLCLIIGAAGVVAVRNALRAEGRSEGRQASPAEVASEPAQAPRELPSAAAAAPPASAARPSAPAGEAPQARAAASAPERAPTAPPAELAQDKPLARAPRAPAPSVPAAAAAPVPATRKPQGRPSATAVAPPRALAAHMSAAPPSAPAAEAPLDEQGLPTNPYAEP